MRGRVRGRARRRRDPLRGAAGADAQPARTVFRNNLMATFNVAEACVRMGADRIVNVSSETVAGMAFAERPFHAASAPIDESRSCARRTRTRWRRCSASS